MSNSDEKKSPVLRPNFRKDNQSGLERAVAQREGRRKKGLSWGELDTNEVGRFVARICDAGNGLVLGKTSDGGALSITVLDGTTKIKEYPNTVEDFEDLCNWAEISFEGDATAK